MRVYRSVTAPEFVTESVEMKMRWLARQLRSTNTTAEIEQWVKVVTLFESLLQRVNGDRTRSPTCTARQSKKPWSTFLNISAPHTLNLKGNEVRRDIMDNPSTEEEGRILSLEVEVGENKPKKNIVEETKGESRAAKRRKIGSNGNDELLRMKKSESVKERNSLKDEVILSGAVHKEKDKLKEGTTLEVEGNIRKLEKGCQQGKTL